MNWPRSVLVLIALGFLGFGICYTIWPLPMARLTDIPLPSPDARIDFAATYGGMQIGFAVFLLACVRRASWLEPGLWAASAVLLGFLLVRLQSILVISGRPTRAIWTGVAIEVAGSLAALFALRRTRGR